MGTVRSGFIALLIALAGCDRAQTLPSPPAPAAAVSARGLPTAEVLTRFHARATEEERRDFERLRVSADRDSRVRAMEIVLFRLNIDELWRIGVVAVAPDGIHWAVAFGTDKPDVVRAVFDVCERIEAPACASFGHGMAGYYVPREKFFEVRRALLELESVQELGLRIVTPEFSFDA